jgi:predicted ribosome quality control (RQC) complex YloA/Tae2 family protein
MTAEEVGKAEKKYFSKKKKLENYISSLEKKIEILKEADVQTEYLSPYCG